MKKIKIYSETVYAVAILLLSLSVAMITATNYGISMIVAPAYLISLKFGITFGQGEYIIQAILFIVFCVLMKRLKPIYLTSFLTGIIYGTVLDFWRLIFPHFNPEITPPGNLPVYIKLIYFVVGMFMTSFSIALLFRTYIYPQVYDFFVKGISEKYKLNRDKFKILFDFSCLAVSIILTYLLFGRFVGIGVGTFIMTAFNGFIIGMFGKILDKYFYIVPAFDKLNKTFEI